jgi:hypothetical protein
MNITTEIINQTCKTINFSSIETFLIGAGTGIGLSLMIWICFVVIPNKLVKVK